MSNWQQLLILYNRGLMLLNSHTLKFSKDTMEYKELETFVRHIAEVNNCSNIVKVLLTKEAQSDQVYATIKVADSSTGEVMPNNQTGLENPKQDTGPFDSANDQHQNNPIGQNTPNNTPNNNNQTVDPQKAEEVKSEAVLQYMQDNNIEFDDPTQLDSFLNSYNQTPVNTSTLNQVTDPNLTGAKQQLPQGV